MAKFDLKGMLSERSTQEMDLPEQKTVYRNPEDLIPSKDNFYSTEDTEKLKQSIKALGILQPLLIEERGGKDYILAGHSRRKCCLELIEEGMDRFRKVPCVYKPKIELSTASEEDEIIRKIIIIQSNTYREKTDWEKMTEALQMEELVKELREKTDLEGKTREIVSDLIGVSSTQIGRYHSISSNLSESLMDAFKRNKLNVSTAAELAGLNEKYQTKACELLENAGQLTLNDAKLLKAQQEQERDIPGQLTIEQALHPHKPEEVNAAIPVDIQIDRFYESLRKNIETYVRKSDLNMTTYMLSALYGTVRVRNGHLNYQGSKEGIIFNTGSDQEELMSWTDFSKKLIEKYGKKQKPVKMAAIDEPEELTIKEAITMEAKEQKPEKKVKELKKPDPEEKEYLDMAARHLIMSYYSWMKGDFTNRVLNVNKSPEELKRKLGNDRTRWFAMDKGTAHINMFDDYVQLWDKDSRYMGDYDWFYLATAIQRMWNVIALEKAEKSRKEAETENAARDPGKETKPELALAQTETIPVDGIPAEDINTENLSVRINTDIWPEDLSDIPVPSELFIREYLEEEEKMLSGYLECGGIPERTILRQQLKVAGIRIIQNLVKDVMETEEETIQPELPRLKNNEERKEWLENYQDWGLWYRDERLDVNYYKYDFEDGSRLVVAEYPKREGYWNEEPRDEHFF
ncbi:ParB/RepB/Spo0J family partition protein, partial [Blautia sp.]|uniref:ParB/RepB/Spo0J family partition protein n=1 Tax=Blautia sp. TaxID=1955243 RepID=UPI003AB5A98F